MNKCSLLGRTHSHGRNESMHGLQTRSCKEPNANPQFAIAEAHYRLLQAMTRTREGGFEGGGYRSNRRLEERSIKQ